MNSIFMIIFGMTLVTYIPRAIPFFIVSNKELNPYLKAFLEYIPYTALGALIIPGAITAIPSSPIASIVGLSFAILYSLYKNSMIISIVGSTGIAFIILSLS